MRRYAVLLIVMGLLLVIGVPGAGAAQPEIEEFGPFEFGPEPWRDINGDRVECKDGVRHTGGEGADFAVLHSGSIQGVHKHFAVKGGELIKHQTWVGGTDWLHNSEDNSKVLTGSWHVTDMERTTLAGEPVGALKAQGQHWHITVPGYGTVFLEAGQIVLDFSLLPNNPFVRFNGRTDVGSSTFDAVCAALS